MIEKTKQMKIESLNINMIEKTKQIEMELKILMLKSNK